ncbi:acyl-CoA dehydrogenase family protein [Roseateles sp.]|uniref:acyl-CoA dehydrogenase family protein n=1 Tax=Roseateles sp. TaxID=1971397 RepID=UPI003263C1A4
MPYLYRAPLREMRFVIERVLHAPALWAQCEAWVDLDMGTVGAVLEEAARFASEVLQPINAAGDAQGCRLQDGSVRTPDAFPAAYKAFVEGGWPALPCSPDWGGQGLPMLVDAAVREMLSACNHGWNMYPDLLHGAYETLKAHGTDELKSRYLEDVATGRTLAAMALTEPQAGSDLGVLTTKAQPQPDGTLRVSGSKIFISGADHDLTEQIVHFVLCRLPDASPGTKGITLVIVPKWLPDGRRNTWAVTGIEHKMGIHGSATCAVSYDGATSWIVGQPHCGLAAMFLMMNSARLHVGLQGLGHQQMATQNALRHAAERVQMKQPIQRHPAMRQLLLRLQVLTQAQRVLAYRAALAIDVAAAHPDAGEREAAQKIAGLLTPLVKAWLTQQGFAAASDALQVFGGYGYTREYGVEQTLRDSRIAMVYEGTNEIQAIDLLQRKVLADGGAALALLLAELEAEATRCAEVPALQDYADALRGQIAQSRSATAAVQAQAASDAEAALRVADDYLMGTAHLLLAWALAASARAALDEPDRAWAHTKTEQLRHGLQALLPDAAPHWLRVHAVARPLPQVSPAT